MYHQRPFELVAIDANYADVHYSYDVCVLMCSNPTTSYIKGVVHHVQPAGVLVRPSVYCHCR